MRQYFGTDGVRGVANAELTPELAYRLGRCGGYLLTKAGEGRKTVLVGRDTRVSGEMLEAALVAGLLSIGVDVMLLGVIPTPGVAYMTRFLHADAGVMISASHNPVEDNGIKFFGPDGFKLSDEMEQAIEALIDAPDEMPRPVGADVGRIRHADEAGVKDYQAYLKSTFSLSLVGKKIVLDCANGAASYLAPNLFRELGAEVHVLAASPDGININVDCGSTHPERLQAEVPRLEADFGFAYDGDADRLIAVDDKGMIVDGDMVMAICADYLNRSGRLNKGTVVSTVMSNFGFYEAMKKMGIQTERTSVGDRYVMACMRENGYNLGGEQSGHIIFLDYNTTGDGVLTSLRLAEVIADTHKTLSQLAGIMKKYPQILKNVRVRDKQAVLENQEVAQSVRQMEERLKGNGRILIRPSGTEPLVRVMAEGPDLALLEEIVQEIVSEIEKQGGVL
jgi:phosphoglucosamine mutase